MPDTLHHWTEETLAALPVKSGFRQRGMDMTRLETFTDAAFAFAVTLLVISVDDVPDSYAEFVDALKKIPAFIACFMQLMLFWWGHHSWSRRYGLEDGLSMAFSLLLVAVVLIYVYPLRVIFGAFFANATGNVLPEPFPLAIGEIGKLFAVFGIGFSALAAILVALYLVALRRRASLALSPRELLLSQGEVVGWSVVMLTGMISTLLALTLPEDLSPLSGFVYWSLAVTMPLFAIWFRNRNKALADQGDSRQSNSGETPEPRD